MRERPCIFMNISTITIDLNFTQFLFVLSCETCDIHLPLHISSEFLTWHDSIYFVQSNFMRGRPRIFMNISTITMVYTGNAGYGKATNSILENKWQHATYVANGFSLLYKLKVSVVLLLEIQFLNYLCGFRS
jgi:hypothetical protein